MVQNLGHLLYKSRKASSYLYVIHTSVSCVCVLELKCVCVWLLRLSPIIRRMERYKTLSIVHYALLGFVFYANNNTGQGFRLVP